MGVGRFRHLRDHGQRISAPRGCEIYAQADSLLSSRDRAQDPVASIRITTLRFVPEPEPALPETLPVHRRGHFLLKLVASSRKRSQAVAHQISVLAWPNERISKATRVAASASGASKMSR